MTYATIKNLHKIKYLQSFFLIDNKSFIEEKEQCVYDCKLIALETNTNTYNHLQFVFCYLYFILYHFIL